MSVSQDTVLPAQPAAGDTQYIGLGGNGFDAPQSYYEISAALAGDASGGTSTISVQMDPRFVSMISFLQISLADPGAAVVGRFIIAPTANHSLQEIRTLPYAAPGGVAVDHWCPPAMLLSSSQVSSALTFPYVRSQVPNVNGETHYFTARVYNFDKTARERVPLRLMVQNLLRGG